MLGLEFTAFLEACPVAAIIVDAAGVVVFANGAAHRLFHSGDRLPGSSVGDWVAEWPLPPGVTRSLVIDGNGDRVPAHTRALSWSTESGTKTALFVEAGHGEPLAGSDASEAELRLRYIIEMLPEAVCVFDADDQYVLWNEKYAELYADIAGHLRPGIPFEEILKISIASGEMLEVAEDKEAWLRERMEKFRRPVSQEVQQLRDGRWLRHDDRRTPDGGAIGMRIDITDLKQREEWLRQLFDENPMPMLLCDGESLAILQANTAAVDFYGLEATDLLSRSVRDMHADGEGDRFVAAVQRLDCDCEARTVWRHRATGGLERHVLVYVRLLHEGTSRRFLLTVADVSERVIAEAEANRLAHHDPLTGLPNRMQFYKVLEERLAGEKAVAVFCLDLDGFKPINDTFGHAAGDEVLKLVADRLSAETEDHMVARLGGDEFAILMAGETGGAVDLAERCVAAFERPFLIRGLSIKIGVSVGVAVSPRDGIAGETLIQEADRALYRAKAAGRNTWRTASDDGASVRHASV
ncbi:diguanylate cyclase [Pseudomonas sp. R2.Fl]|nr:diguanylate cyclase [Pseudomonas sp. R2.Fl]